jgi:hypothetical protein
MAKEDCAAFLYSVFALAAKAFVLKFPAKYS